MEYPCYELFDIIIASRVAVGPLYTIQREVIRPPYTTNPIRFGSCYNSVLSGASPNGIYAPLFNLNLAAPGRGPENSTKPILALLPI